MAEVGMLSSSYSTTQPVRVIIDIISVSFLLYSKGDNDGNNKNDPDLPGKCVPATCAPDPGT
jgi:hypothetical protein